MQLTREQIATYERDGVLPVGRVLTDEQLVTARERLDRMVAEEKVDRPESPTKDGHTIRRLDVSQHDPWFGSVVRSPAILDIAESALGPNIQYYQDNIFYKPANVGGATPWHQDNIWWHGDPPNMLTIWVALDDVDPDNGPVHYVKGSHVAMVDHTMPVHDPGGFTYNLIDPKQVGPELQSRVVSFSFPAGHAVMHHCQTVHSAPPNASPRPRRGYTISLMQAGLFGPETEKQPLLRGRMPVAKAATITAR